LPFSRKISLLAISLFAGALTLAAPLAAEASGPAATPEGPKLTETQIEQVETQILGPEHAAEHAAIREHARAENKDPEAALAAAHAAGADAVTPKAAGPADQVGQWAAPFNIPIFGINAVMLPTGKVMWWSYPFGSRINTSQAFLWDPATGQTKEVDPPLGQDYDGDGHRDPANIWCSGMSMLADGRVLVTGGNLEYDPNGLTNYKGLNKVYTFNPFNETWTEQPSMQHGRWYPGQLRLPDGRVVIMSGYDESGTGKQNDQIDVFTPSPDMNGVGTLKTVATTGGEGNPPQGELYPRMFAMPDGRNLVAGPDPYDTWLFNVGPAPGDTFDWSDYANFDVSPTSPPGGDSRLWSSSTLEPGPPSGSTKVTIMGGRPFAPTPPDQPLRTTETIDEANLAAGWQPGPSLNIGRSHLNTVLLPDGSKLVVGGGVGNRGAAGQWAFDEDQKQVELFDPATNSWRLGAAQQEGRAYHSTAILMPDGRVISAGDDYNPDVNSDTAEIYSPPYLFKGPRPTISSAPATLSFGDRFGVGSPDQVSKAVLMAPSATTHGDDMNQREVALQVSNTVPGAGINLVSPPSQYVAPPGYYMLFLLNAQGVPSVSKWVRIDPTAPDRPEVLAGVAGTKKSGNGCKKSKSKAKAKKAKAKGKHKQKCKRKHKHRHGHH
jgi:hypothetical protein